jgi:O-acetyl-ADP-ribose deacetylase (regulator of RNase III)
MGKGIALQFKEAFPHNNKVYVEACKKSELSPGKLLAVWDSNLLLGKKLIINFPTKKHWRHPSKYEYIESGLIALVELLEKENVRSVALPPLGCGNGGLEWPKVKSLIVKYLQDSDVEIFVFEPNAEIKALLQEESSSKDVKLTPARAQLLFALFVYESFGENSSLFAANKLAYFLQRMGQPLQLHFKRNNYGPYALGVEKVLYTMNGVYLKGLEQQEAKPFEALQLNYEKWYEVKEYIDKNLGSEEKDRIMSLVSLISGFTSELSLEILSSVSFILDENPNFSYEQVKEEIGRWSKRKQKLFKDEFLAVAYNHLINYRELPFQ